MMCCVAGHNPFSAARKFGTSCSAMGAQTSRAEALTGSAATSYLSSLTW